MSKDKDVKIKLNSMFGKLDENDRFKDFCERVMALNRLIIPKNIMDIIEDRFYSYIIKDPRFDIIQAKDDFVTGFSQGMGEMYIAIFKTMHDNEEENNEN